MLADTPMLEVHIAVFFQRDTTLEYLPPLCSSHTTESSQRNKHHSQIVAVARIHGTQTH